METVIDRIGRKNYTDLHGIKDYLEKIIETIDDIITEYEACEAEKAKLEIEVTGLHEQLAEKDRIIEELQGKLNGNCA